MQIRVSTQEEYHAAVKKRLHVDHEIIVQNSSDFITVFTNVTVGENGRCKTTDDLESPITVTVRENGLLAAEGKTTVLGYDHANVIAKGNCKVTLRDSSSGNCFDHCNVTLHGNAKTEAGGHCTVNAFDESSVSASGSSKVYAHQNSVANGTDVTSLSGKDYSTLIGKGKCSITAKDNCIVYAHDDCTVTAADNVLIVADKKAKITSQDNCLVMANGSPEISLSGQADYVNLDLVNDKNIMGTLKQMAQSKAIVERPYVALEILKDKLPPGRKEAVNRRLATMGLKDQVSTKNYLYSLIEAGPAQKMNTRAELFDLQLKTAMKAGYVQGVCECAAVVHGEKNLDKKLLSEMNVTKDMAKKYAHPETYKTLEKTVFAPRVEHTMERQKGISR